MLPTPNAEPVPLHVVRFRAIASAISDTYERKNHDYGNSFSRSVEKYGLIAALTRISDKFNRLETLILNKNANFVADESLCDTLMDLAAYSIMTAMELKKSK